MKRYDESFHKRCCWFESYVVGKKGYRDRQMLKIKHVRALLSASLILFSCSAFSAEFAVTTALDLVDENPGDGVCETGDGRCSLRAAIMESNVLDGSDVIKLPPNNYLLVVGSSGEDGALGGDLDILDDLTIVGEDPKSTIISGNYNAFRVIQVLKGADGTLPKVTIKNITLTKGTGKGSVIHNGGITKLDNVIVTDASPDNVAVFNDQDLIVTNSQFIGNFSAIRSSKQSRILTISNSVFDGNGGNGGGAVYSSAQSTIIETSKFTNNVNTSTLYSESSGKYSGGGAAVFNKGTILISDSNFIGNQSSDGGAIISSGYLTIINSVFSGNSTIDGAFMERGGALYTTGHTDIVDGTFVDNKATGPGGVGGAIYCHHCQLHLTRVSLSGNTADKDGGAINQFNGMISVADSTISGNTAGYFGGGVILRGNSSLILFSNSQITGNTASEGGGGVCLSNAKAMFQNVTVSGNTSSSGGGFYNSGTSDDHVLELINVTVSNNAAQVGSNLGSFPGSRYSQSRGKIRLSNTLIANPIGGENCAGEEGLVSTGYNLSTDDSCQLTEPGDLPNAQADLGELGDNGGRTMTHALGRNSAAIDAGNPNVCLNAPKVDQRYYYRNDVRCDIGAFEYGSSRSESGALAFGDAVTSVSESAGVAEVTIKRLGGKEGAVSVNVYSEPFGTAIGRIGRGADYKPVDIDLTWEDGDDADKIIEIPIIDDGREEDVEEFFLKLRHISGGANLGEQEDHVVRIIDDEAAPGILLFEEISTQFREDGGTLSLNVIRTQGNSGTVSVDYITESGNAVEGEDFTAKSGTLTFLDGETVKTITLDIVNDYLAETTESFRIVLSNPKGGVALGVGKVATIAIMDDDKDAGYDVGTDSDARGAGVFSFDTPKWTVPEATPWTPIRIFRKNGTNGKVSVDISTIGISATSGIDFLPISKTVTFLEGEMLKEVKLRIIDDSLKENNETISIRLSNPTGGAVLSSKGSVTTIIIKDNDTIGSSDPIGSSVGGDAVKVESGGGGGGSIGLFTLILFLFMSWKSLMRTNFPLKRKLPLNLDR